MLKLNNKGMAISGILYSILVLFLVLLFGILTLLASSKNTFDKLKENAIMKIDGNEKILVTNEACFEFDEITATITKYNSGENCSSQVTLPESIRGVMVEKIADSAFENQSLQSVDLSFMTFLKEIGKNAFHGNEIQMLYLGNLRNLVTIGENAFAGKIGTETKGNTIKNAVDFTGMVSIKNIEKNAFYNNKISELKFADNTNLVSIGDSAFEANEIEGVLDLSGLAGIKTIGTKSFASNKIEKVNFGNHSYLTSIGASAFYSNDIRGVIDLSRSAVLTTVGTKAFCNNTDISQIKVADISKITGYSTVTLLYAATVACPTP